MGFRDVWFRATPGVRANGDVPWCPLGWRSLKSNGRSEHDQIPGTLAFSRCARNAQLCSAPAAGGTISERTQTPTSPLCHGEFSISMELADQERRGNRERFAPVHRSSAGSSTQSLGGSWSGPCLVLVKSVFGQNLLCGPSKTSSVGPAAAGAPGSTEPQHFCQLLSFPPPQHPLIFRGTLLAPRARYSRSSSLYDTLRASSSS